MMRAKGFTLIELLVVIAIIGLLSSVVMVSLNSVRAKGQEAKRRGDMNALIQAIALYRNDHNYYPPLNASGPGCTSNTCVSHMGPDLVPSYIRVLPEDPVKKGTTMDYRYCRSGTVTNEYALLRYSQITNNWCNVQTPAPISGSYCWHVNGVPSSTYPACK